MATRNLAQFAALGGVTVTETALLGLFDLSFTASCSGCQGGTTESTNYQPEEMARGAALRWAERHSAGCRRIPAN